MNFEYIKEQNPWWIAKEKIETDVHLEKLTQVVYVWNPPILDSLNLEHDAIYTLRGSRQIGKTTALKLLVKKLLANNQKENILYCTCNAIESYKELIKTLEDYLDWNNNGQRKYIFIDEITFVDSWTRAIKHLADLGRLKNCTLILTGSNAHDLKYEIERMPGRRGEDAGLDKILFPLTFREYVSFRNPELTEKFSALATAKKNYVFYEKELKKILDEFLLTGGYIKAINSYVAENKINAGIYEQYLSWILGDLAKLGRKEVYSRQVLEQVIMSLTTNIGYDTIAQKTSIGSHLTVLDYIDVMESNFILKVLYQVDLNKKTAVSRKTKKIYFQDVFLYWIFFGYVYGLTDYFHASSNRLQDPILKSKLIENLVMSSLMKLENTVIWSNIVFFSRNVNQNEVDFVIKNKEIRLIPLEVKYKNDVDFRDFLHLDKINHHRGIVVSKQTFEVQENKLILPVEVFLLLDVKELLQV